MRIAPRAGEEVGAIGIDGVGTLLEREIGGGKGIFRRVMVLAAMGDNLDQKGNPGFGYFLIKFLK